MNSPTPLLPLRELSLELCDTAALRCIERQSAQGALMERAGLAVARLVRAAWPLARRVSIVCGPGNNGGDGYVAARHLRAQGIRVQVVTAGSRRPPSVERQRAEAALLACGLRTSPLTDLDPGAECVVDALLGLGLRGAPDGELLMAVEAMNRHAAPKLGVDLPSGLQADTGHAPGAVVRCAHTLSLLAPTPGLFTGEGRQQAGRIWLDRLGCETSESPIALAGSPRGLWQRHSARARWPHSGHKGSAGQVWVLQGTAAMAGAARLAARAALAAGAGRVYLSGETVDADPLWPELMRASVARALTAVNDGVAILGCGGGDEVASQLAGWLERAAQLVLDADALNALAQSTALQQTLIDRDARGQRSVITPHPLEAARLLCSSTAAVQADRLTAARRLAERFQCTAVLKGSGTVIATPGIAPHINSSGHAALGTAGTGDVLAGWLGGLLAQAPMAPLHELAAIACAWQGEAADSLPLGGGPLRASELINAMAAMQP